MAELKCGAGGCAYNRDTYCCKGDIMVGSNCACDSSGTCCESFRERKEGSYTSSLDHPSFHISIDCEAVRCMYNSDYKCVADHVDIRGCNAKDAKATECHTFKEK